MWDSPPKPPAQSMLTLYCLVAGLGVVEHGNKESITENPTAWGVVRRKKSQTLGTDGVSTGEGVDPSRRVRSHSGRRWHVLSSSLKELLARFQKSQLARPQVLDDRMGGF